MAQKLVSCTQQRRDCFAYYLGKCTCLDDTEFKKPCPFYKSIVQHEKDMEKYPYNPISCTNYKGEKTK